MVVKEKQFCVKEFNFQTFLQNFEIWPLLTLTDDKMLQRRLMDVQRSGCAIKMLQMDMLHRQVAWWFNVSKTEIERLWERFQNIRRVQQRPRSGKLRRITAHGGPKIVLLAKRIMFTFAETLNKKYRNDHGVHIFTRTLRDGLHAVNLHAHKPTIGSVCAVKLSKHTVTNNDRPSTKAIMLSNATFLISFIF